MKTVCLFILAIFLCSVTVQSTCLAKNPFLAPLKDSHPIKVEILAKPITTDIAHCKSEWSKFGTCCKSTDLVAFADLEGRLIDLNHKHLVNVVNKVGVQLSQQKFVSNFEKDSWNCWNHMKVARSSALCSICSGRSETFFKDEKALINPDTCLKATDACQNFFTKIAKIRQLITLEAVKLNSAELNNLERDLNTFSPPAELIAAFTARSSTTLNNESKLKASFTICSMIMNLRKRPYILIMNHEGIKHFLEVVEQKIKADALLETEKEKEKIIAKEDLAETINKEISRDSK